LNRQKVIERLLSPNPPKELRVDVVLGIYLNDLGWTYRKKVGSHHQLTKPGYRTEVVTEHGNKVGEEVIRKLIVHLKAGQ
jgi:predicted RNA binding protein YcfA (HicA-like mRNA interferase family)